MAKLKLIKPKYETLLAQYQARITLIQESTQVDVSEGLAARNTRKARLLDNYAAFAKYYFPHYCTGEPAKFHIKLAKTLSYNKNAKLVRKWARSLAKSTNCAIMIPAWLMLRGELNFMVLASATEDAAVGLLSDLQAELEANQRLIHDWGEFQRIGNWEFGDFTTKQGVRFKAIGRRQSPRGLRNKQHRPDYILCDDLDDDELVKNPKRVALSHKWAMSALFGSFSAKGGRFVFVGNLISKTSVLQMVSDNEMFETEQVNLLDKEGKPSWDYYTQKECDDMIKTMGHILSQREYFNNPIEAGTIFKEEYFQYKKAFPLTAYESLVCYTDPSFTSSSKSDFKSTILLGKWKHEYHIIKGFCGQVTISTMVDWWYEIIAFVKGEANVEYWMEEVMLQFLIMHQVDEESKTRAFPLPIRGDKRKKPDKLGRIIAMSPLFEKGYFFISEAEKGNHHIKTIIEQFKTIEKGSTAPDDAPDATEGAMFILNSNAVSHHHKPIVINRKTESSKYRY